MLLRATDLQYISKYSYIIGIDEAGRGPLAGPVVAAALCVVGDADLDIEGIADSKLIKEDDRERIYEELTSHPRVLWAVSVVEHTEIDEVNILQATMNGMRRATEQLLSRHKQLVPSNCLALVDGNRCPDDLPVASQFVIKGDSKVFSIAAASIIAKVTRDRLMAKYHELYPQYNFLQHKGYPTFSHRATLHAIGPCPIHRVTFGPVRDSIAAQSAKAKDAQSKKRTAITKPKAHKVASSAKMSRRVVASDTKEVIEGTRRSARINTQSKY